jgi:hypothetical protein
MYITNPSTSNTEKHDDDDNVTYQRSCLVPDLPDILSGRSYIQEKAFRHNLPLFALNLPVRRTVSLSEATKQPLIKMVLFLLQNQSWSSSKVREGENQ